LGIGLYFHPTAFLERPMEKLEDSDERAISYHS